MADKFQNKYRIPSARAAWWDYGDNASYFVTICTANKNHWFGQIKNGVMILSETGKLAEDCWNEIPQHFPHVVLDAFVIMPNHVHGIITINKEQKIPPRRDATSCVSKDSRDATSCVSLNTNINNETENIPNVDMVHVDKYDSETQDVAGNRSFDLDNYYSETQDVASLRETVTGTKNKFGPQSDNLPSIIRGFKIGVTKDARKHNPLFAWQARYHDHIIRSTDEYIRISHYILTNVANWEDDCFNL